MDYTKENMQKLNNKKNREWTQGAIYLLPSFMRVKQCL